MSKLAGKDRLIVALDVSSHEDAIRLVKELDNVSVFKVGLQLLMAGNILGFIERLRSEREQGQVFIDLKIGGDIQNTIKQFMIACINTSIVKFITLVETVPLAITLETVKTAKSVRDESGTKNPRLLMVPYLSSLDAGDLNDGGRDLNSHIVERAGVMLNAGCDGLIVSGDAIRWCRDRFPKIDIVSPGIRPAGASHDDHKRFTTPAEAITLGADYLVVGRPIIKAPKPRDAAKRIIDEIDEALDKKNSSSPSGSSNHTSYITLAAKGQG